MTELDTLKKKLTDALRYDPETGDFIWLISKSGAAKAGSVAGSTTKGGYRCIKFEQHSIYLHRLAWLFAYGSFPNGVIDHRDGNPANNKLLNLRDVTQSINMQNQRRATAANKSGFLGVSFHPFSGLYVSRITSDGKTKYLGYFKSPEEAHQTYLTAKRKLHAGCVI